MGARNSLGEKTSPYAAVKWPMGAKGSFALNGNHEMYADGNGYWRMVPPRMALKERGSGWGEAVLGGTAEALGRSSATRELARNGVRGTILNAEIRVSGCHPCR
jgi:fructose-1-phosphate kinase PfkB-like protein